MFNRLFKRKKEPEPNNNDWEKKLVWLAPGHADNPFQQEILDCRAVALTFTSVTKDPGVAATFNALRSSDGSDVRGRSPDQALVIDCELRFPFNGQHNDGPVFLARQMEDKWDFYTFDNRLYIRRSWTGYLTHVAELEYASDVVIVRRIHCEPNTIFGDRDFAVAQLRFLIATHMGRSLIPFPIPPGTTRADVRNIALLGFNQYGRRAQFASCLTIGRAGG